MKRSPLQRPRWQIALALFALALVLALVPVLSVFTQAHAAGANTSTKPTFFNFKGITYSLAKGQNGSSPPPPPTDKECRQKIGVPCYSPQEIRKAYNLEPVLDAGFTGKGQTIVIIDSFGSPTIQKDLKVFDQAFGLPDPPSFKVLAPLGKVKFNPNDNTMVGWAAETSLDVEWSHALAPDANIVLMTSPVAETQGDMGMPEFLYLEQYAVKHNLGKIISQSWATTENTLFTTPGGRKILKNFETFYQ